MISLKLQEYFKNNPNLETPCVVFDLEILRAKYSEFKLRFPKVDIFYAVKCNPAKPVLATLRDLGSNFDVASIEEVELCLSLGINPSKISWGSTIKKPYLVKKAFAKGVNLFAYDSIEDLQSIAINAPGSKVYCRILVSNDNALWPLSAKFGCSLEMAEDLLLQAKKLNLIPFGLSFHVGSQQIDLGAWDRAITNCAYIYNNLQEKHGITLQMINLGGGYPAEGYVTGSRDLLDYANAIEDSLNKNFGEHNLMLLAEPGRFLVADAGVMKTEVVLVSKKACDADLRWVYLDVGLYGGLAETLAESIKYKMFTSRDSDKNIGPVNLAGPTCDGIDIMYKEYKYQMPLSLQIGDYIYILATGAYTTTYSTVAFNGFTPLKDIYID